MISSSPSLVETRGPIFGGSKVPPPLGLSRPSLGLKPLAKTSSFGVKNEWSGVTSVASWNVKSEDLELVPEDYPLERTHREIMDTDVSVISNRISLALSSMSVEAQFDCENAKAKCKTGDYVGFRIRLYAGSESGQPVVVEVQRRCGSASSFMQTCRAILLAAEGKDIATANSKPSLQPFMKKPIGQMKCLQSIIAKEDTV